MSLPKLFVYGDSISIGYGPFLKEILAEQFEYERKSGEEQALLNLDLPVGSNGGDTRRCLQYMVAYRDRGGLPADYLLINCGLHDLKTKRDTGEKQVPLHEFALNLRQIIDIVQPMVPNVIWVRITPVHEQWHTENKPFDRFSKDVDAYNAAADAVMTASGAKICDLFTHQTNAGEGMLQDGVHFDEAAQKRQAEYIAGFMADLASAGL